MFNIFHKKQIAQNQIIFTIQDDKKISITLDIDAKSANIGKTVAELLYGIHIGDLEGPIVSMIMDLQNKPEYADLVEEIIFNWLQLKKDHEKIDSKPYISPLKVFNNER